MEKIIDSYGEQLTKDLELVLPNHPPTLNLITFRFYWVKLINKKYIRFCFSRENECIFIYLENDSDFLIENIKLSFNSSEELWSYLSDKPFYTEKPKENSGLKKLTLNDWIKLNEQ